MRCNVKLLPRKSLGILLMAISGFLAITTAASWFYFYMPNHDDPYTSRFLDETHGDVLERTRDLVESNKGMEFEQFVQGYDTLYLYLTQEPCFPYRWLALPLAIIGTCLFTAGWLSYRHESSSVS